MTEAHGEQADPPVGPAPKSGLMATGRGPAWIVGSVLVVTAGALVFGATQLSNLSAADAWAAPTSEPVATQSAEPSPTPTPEPVKTPTATPVPDPTPTAEPQPAPPAPPAEEVWIEYTVRKDDTLTSIAREYGVQISDIVEINSIRTPNLIHTGDRLRIRRSG